jgi:hypothetical protein
MNARKVLFTFLVLCFMLVTTAGDALAANGLLTLVEVRNDPLGGVIFVFEVSGEFGRHELRNGTVHVQGADGDYGIHCNRVSEDTLQCTTTQKVAAKYVWLNLAGFIFWTYVPEKPAPVLPQGPSQYCYIVYSLEWDQQENTYWKEVDVHCQDVPAQEGDTIEYENSPYEFFYNSPSCFNTKPAPGEGYFEGCLF